MKNKNSPELEADALKVAKSTQKPGQTKEQTKLIAKGIEKGIAEYKKQHSKKLREMDKQRKQKLKQRELDNGDQENEIRDTNNVFKLYLPWVLLSVSWLGFIGYTVL
ncbi:DUF2956 domain-containing protein [Paraglaciecola sp.]|uniref:DUF2956 domain-containing protein n=1 Tax=Paraglaciecola sp. TaxID=1920173 RepID=UPI003EF9C796